MPGRYICVVNDPHQGVVTMHILLNSHRGALVNGRHIWIESIRAYKSDVTGDEVHD